MSELIECVACGRRSFYEKRRCLECGASTFETVVAGTGELLSVTTVHVTPDGVREPNVLGLAAFEGGANVIAQLDDPTLQIGDAVRLTPDRALRTTGDGVLEGARLAATE